MKTERESRMDNPKTQATLDTKDRGRRQTNTKNTTQKHNKMSYTEPIKNQGERMCSRRALGSYLLLATHHVALIVKTYWTPLYTNTQITFIKHEPFYKYLGVAKL